MDARFSRKKIRTARLIQAHERHDNSCAQLRYTNMPLSFSYQRVRAKDELEEKLYRCNDLNILILTIKGQPSYMINRYLIYLQ